MAAAARPRGRPRKTPLGPCANLCCPRGLCVFIRCACAGVAGEHSIFHQDCHASTGNEDTLIGVGHTTTSKWPEPAALDFGRLCSASLGSTDHAGVKVPNRDLRWRKVPADEQARARAGLQLLPDNAVVCGECSGALRLSGQPLGDDAAREHLQGVLAANVAELPDAALSALAGWCTLRAWLRQSDGSISESSDGWRPVWLTPQCTRLNAVAGGRVLAKGRGGAMPSIVRGMVDFALNISSEAAAGTRAIFQALSAAVPSSFWAVSGETFREQLSEVTNDRVRRIRARELNCMTSIAKDWGTIPAHLRTWIVHATATQREWLRSDRPLSKRRAQQLARARYAIIMSLVHAVEPRCDQPLHQPLHRLAFFGGDSYILRTFLARFNVLTSEEGARLTRIYESDESTVARKLYVQKRLDEGSYFMLAVDNLDWATMRSAVHLYQRSKGDQGRHILNRMAFELKTTPTIRALPDKWTPFKDVTLEDVIETTAEEKKSFAGFVKRFADAAKEYTGDEMDRDILSFRSLINKRPLTDTQAASLSTSKYRKPNERSRQYHGERRDESGAVTQRRGFASEARSEEEEMPARLLRNLGAVGKIVTLPSALPASKVHDWPTPALDAGTTLKAVMALDKGMSVHVDADTRTEVMVPDAAFFGEWSGSESSSSEEETDEEQEEDGLTSAAATIEQYDAANLPQFSDDARDPAEPLPSVSFPGKLKPSLKRKETDVSSASSPSMTSASLDMKPSNMQGSMILNAHHSKAGDLKDIEKSEREFRSNLTEWTKAQVELNPGKGEQIKRFATAFDGQPANEKHKAALALRQATALRRQELVDTIAAAGDDDPCRAEEEELKAIDAAAAAGPSLVLWLGGFHARQNVYEVLHSMIHSAPFLKVVGYIGTKLLNLQNQARGYMSQNHHFFQQLSTAFLLEFHTLAQSHLPQPCAIEDTEVWMGCVRKLGLPVSEGGGGCATIAWWFDMLESAFLPVLALLDAVRQTQEPELNAQLEGAALKMLLDVWFAMNRTTYMSIVPEYLISRRRMSEQWRAIHAHNLGAKLVHASVDYDEAVEVLVNRLTKQMLPKVSTEEQAIDAANTVELHSALMEKLKLECGMREVHNIKPPKAARDFGKNVAGLRGLIKDKLIENAECLLPHDLPMAVFEGKAVTHRVTARELHKCAAERKTALIHDVFLATHSGGQYETDTVPGKPRFTRLQVYGSNAKTQRQLETENRMLRNATAQAHLSGPAARGPYQLTKFDERGVTFATQFLKKDGPSKGLYREALLRCFTTSLANAPLTFCGSRVEGARKSGRIASGCSAATYRRLSTNILHYPGSPNVTANVFVTDAMFLLRPSRNAPANYLGKEIKTGADLVWWFVKDKILIPAIEAGFTTVDAHFDAQSGLAKAGLEAWRSQMAGMDSVADADLTIHRAEEVKTRDLKKIAMCRDVGRESFFSVLADVMKDTAWVSSLELPDDFEFIVRGASREVLGEATCARTHRGVLTIVPLDPVWHEEADTSVVYAALQHATKDETVAVLMCTQDNDSLLAAQAGFAEAIDAAGGQGSSVAAAAKKVHLQMKGWWLTPEGKRVLGRPSPATVSRRALKQSQVLHVGQIVLDMMFSDSTTMAWLPPGKDRVLTFVWASAFFGGDTVPTIAGFTPKAGGEALHFLKAAIGPLLYETGLGASVELQESAQALVKACVFGKHSTWFDTDTTPNETWVAATPLQDMADTVYEKRRDKPSDWVLSPDQIRLQCLKTSARVTEWATSWKAKPGLVHANSPKHAEHGWPRNPNQLKGLHAVDASGEPLTAGTEITRQNVAPKYGLGWDVDAQARRIHGDDDACPSAPSTGERVLENAFVARVSLATLEQLGLRCLQHNVKLRSTFSGGKWHPLGVGGSGKVAAQKLKALVKEHNRSPMVDATPTPASGAAAPAANPAPRRAAVAPARPSARRAAPPTPQPSNLSARASSQPAQPSAGRRAGLRKRR